MQISNIVPELFIPDLLITLIHNLNKTKIKILHSIVDFILLMGDQDIMHFLC